MRVKRQTADNLKAINAALAARNDENLESVLMSIGVDELLNPDLMHLARGSHLSQAVILLASIGAENSPQPAQLLKILKLYQSLVTHRSSDALRDYDPKHLLRQSVRCILEKSLNIDLNHDHVGTDIYDWLDAIELAIDFEHAALAEKILIALRDKAPGDNIFMSIKYRLTERYPLQRDVTDFAAFSRCLGIVHDALVSAEWDEEKQDILLFIMETSKKAKIWNNIIALEPLLKREKLKEFGAFRIAEAFCHDQNYVKSIEHLDLHLSRYLDNRDKKLSAEERAHPQPIIEGSTDDIPVEDFSAARAGHALADLSEVLEKVGNQMFLVSGTLLGYARNGSVLPHDKDIDVGIFGWESQFDIIEAIVKTGRFRIFPRYLNGTRTHQLPVYHLESKMTIDMFIFHKEGNKFITGVNPPWGYLQRFAFSPFLLKEVEFLGVKTHVPANFDRHLTENFGNWRLPTPDYVSHVESPSTMDQGEPLHLLVCRLNLIEAIYKKKPSRIPRILAVLKQFENQTGAMSVELFDRISNYASSLGSSAPLIQVAS